MKIKLFGSVLLATLLISNTSFAFEHAKVVGTEECGECHEDEVTVWKETHHYKSFYELSRSDEGRKIAEKMGISRIKKDSDCLSCHFMQAETDGKLEPISGIACESCHAPAKDWVETHNDYGGKDVKKEQETPEHKAKRIADMEQAGMIRPTNLYALANNCYQCHLVPNEKLVNVGGHTAGSKFELVSWSHGEIRHNFFRSESGKDNIESSLPRKRMMFVMGRVLELEHSLRGVAKATQKASYAVKMAKRAQVAIAWLKKINGLVKLPEVDNMLKIAGSVKLKLNNADALNAAADKVAKEAQQLASNNDGEALSALDELLPSAEKYKGSPAK
ncbi:MAG: multiheme c-type cytochrome [Pseudomonadota bacterium]